MLWWIQLSIIGWMESKMIILLTDLQIRDISHWHLILLHRFRIYFQQIICFCCLRIWRSRSKKEEPGILHKNSQSEMGRSRSCKSCNNNSVHNLQMIWTKACIHIHKTDSEKYFLFTLNKWICSKPSLS